MLNSTIQQKVLMLPFFKYQAIQEMVYKAS